MRKILLISAALLLFAFKGYSQSEPSGVVITASQFTPLEMLQLSATTNSFTTARASAMGGAFTALGGDLASIGINPAGIGMYTRSSYGLTPSLTVSNSTGSFRAFDNTKTRFALNNVGTVIRLTESSRGVLAFNLGFSYNKLADYNYTGGINIPSAGKNSILNIFALQLNGLYSGWDPISEDALNNDPYNNDGIYIDEWGAVLGYKTHLLGGYPYGVLGLDSQAMTPSMLRYDSRGSTGEYNISGGMNINNIVYLGFGVGIRDISQNFSLYYSEAFGEESIGGTSQRYIKDVNYNQYLSSRGTSVNFKLGAIIRPIPELRIGVAYHSPSYTDIHYEYSASMSAFFHTGGESYRMNTLVAGYNYSFKSAPKLLTGVSVVLGDNIALSFDYEKVWYNKMRLTDESWDIEDSFARAIEADYKSADNIRIGMEVKLDSSIALRAGYAYYDSPFRAKESEVHYNRIITSSSNHFSAGVGFWLGRGTTMDIAYIYSRDKIAPYELFYYKGSDQDGNNVTYWPTNSVTNALRHRHTVSLSFNFLF